MCFKSSNCLCHYLEQAIKQDKTQELKAIFTSYYLDEHYNFILDAYRLLEIRSDNKYTAEMNQLVKNYLLDRSAESINVKNEYVKRDFMSLYDEKIDDLGSARSSLNEKLLLLIKDVQYLVYQNLSGMDSFDNYLAKTKKESMDDLNNVKSHKRSGCTII
ncbi:hypothetical protein [Legionella quateirensis]|uniref:Uncharacterized protein n=1 Tax=Legionella quateirensis TaxID=45072 RepID=A0A378KXS8_9GAMM|nr:hypothetical protein [Legionella quateirensis]KTD43289.1 hypothetical protein Lqua_3190 [Legionella quateirensis]STY18168.1 Uncharacterised protein [Legionella quateirensis]